MREGSHACDILWYYCPCNGFGGGPDADTVVQVATFVAPMQHRLCSRSFRSSCRTDGPNDVKGAPDHVDENLDFVTAPVVRGIGWLSPNGGSNYPDANNDPYECIGSPDIGSMVGWRLVDLYLEPIFSVSCWGPVVCWTWTIRTTAGQPPRSLVLYHDQRRQPPASPEQLVHQHGHCTVATASGRLPPPTKWSISSSRCIVPFAWLAGFMCTRDCNSGSFGQVGYPYTVLINRVALNWWFNYE